MLFALSRSGQAQTSLWLDAAGSSARPPAAGPQTQTSNYAIVGLRAEALTDPWKLDGTAAFGQAVDESGYWFWLQAQAGRSWGTASAFFFDYGRVPHYGTAGLQLQRNLQWYNKALTLTPTLLSARWESDSAAAVYGVAGASVQYMRNAGPLVARIAADALHSGNNGFARGGYVALRAEVLSTLEKFTVGAGLSQGFNPLRQETGYSLWATRLISEQLRIDAQLARTITDPLYGSPRSLGFTLSASWRVSHREPKPPPLLAEVGEPAARGRIVRFNVKPVQPADSVAVSGTFSDWKPLPLHRSGDRWIGAFTIEPGTHQYGFLINGKDWFIPAEAPDVIDDGFGRKNATLVVRPK